MTIDAKTQREIIKKERLFDETKRKAIERITNYVKVAIDNLRTAERELLDEVEIEFGENPFSEFIDDETKTEDEIKSILTQDIPSDFGPDEESFCSLFKEIVSFKSCQKKRRFHAFDLMPQNVRCRNITHNEIILQWEDAKRECFYEVEVKSLPTMDNIYRTSEAKLTLYDLEPDTTYYIRVRTVETQNNGESMWSNPVTVKTDPKYECIWKECPDDVEDERKYSVDVNNTKIAMNIGDNNCTAIGNAFLLDNKTTSWNVRILKSNEDDGCCISIGVAPFDINQNEDNIDKCGWYFHCYDSTLWSGPPHNYYYEEYGPRKEDGKYVHNGDAIGVIMDTSKGNLSFALNGVSLGVAYEGIPSISLLFPVLFLAIKEIVLNLIFLKRKKT